MNENFKISKGTLIYYLCDNHIQPGKYAVVNNKNNIKICDMNFSTKSKNKDLDIFNIYNSYDIVYSSNIIKDESLFIGLLSGAITLKKSVDFFYYSNGYFIKGASNDFSEEEIMQLKKLNNYFEADKYDQLYLNEKFVKHINDNIYNLLATFNCSPINKNIKKLQQ